jgi:diacylglycerol kinase (ATP)
VVKDLKWLAVINPASGGGRAKKRWKKSIKKNLESIGVNYTEYLTEAPGDAIHKVDTEIQNYDGFIAVGGDGTSNEVINGIIRGTIDKGIDNDKYFAIIPAGTGNDIANAFNLPYNDINASCELFKKNKSTSRYVDVGKVTGKSFTDEFVTRYFCGVLSAGFDASVAYKTKDSKFLKGTASYIKALLTNIIWLKSIPFSIKIEESSNTIDTLDQEGVLVAVGLGAYYGAGMKICPEAKVDDGLFHITFLKKIPRRTLLRVFPKVYRGEHVTHPSVILLKAKELEIQTDLETMWQVDGEVLGNPPLKIQTLSKVLKILAPLS